MVTFAEGYLETWRRLKSAGGDGYSRAGQVLNEICGHHARYNVSSGISIFSSNVHRVFPIRFALAEMAWILSGRNDLASIQSYCKVFDKFSDNGLILHGAYGYRLRNQWEKLVNLLTNDRNSRRAVLTIYREEDLGYSTKDIPCNLSMQVLIRNDYASIHAHSRSSDFITGYPIDLFHWQMLAWMVAHQFGCKRAWEVTYAVGSLHLYELDGEVISQWSEDPQGYEHTIFQEKPLLQTIEDCKKYFAPSLNVDNLADILGISSSEKCLALHEMFKGRTKSVQR